MLFADNFLPVTTLWLFRVNYSSQKWMQVLDRVKMKIQILLGRSILCRYVKKTMTIPFNTIKRTIRIILLKFLRSYLRFKCLML